MGWEGARLKAHYIAVCSHPRSDPNQPQPSPASLLLLFASPYVRLPRPSHGRGTDGAHQPQLKSPLIGSRCQRRRCGMILFTKGLALSEGSSAS